MAKAKKQIKSVESRLRQELKEMKESRDYWHNKTQERTNDMKELERRYEARLEKERAAYAARENQVMSLYNDLEWYKETFRLLTLNVETLQLINPRRDRRDPLNQGFDERPF